VATEALAIARVAHDLHVARKAGDSDMLYGSVTNADRTVQGDGLDVGSPQDLVALAMPTTRSGASVC
jgi:hypothetical protein